VQDNVEQRGMNLQFSIVLDETKLPKFVHEKAHSGTSSSDHIGQRLLRDIGNYRFGLAFLSEIG
jgi:hypothetical protein